MLRSSITANVALLNVPVVTARTYRRSVADPDVASRCQAGAAVTAPNDSPVTPAQLVPSALSCTATVTDVPLKPVTCKYACAPEAV